MSSVGEKGGLQRPYTLGTFQKRLNEFEELIKEITLQDVEATPEERRQMITENLRYDQFCDSIRSLFGADIRNQDLKALYRKISTNPDAKVDWSELFGYFQSEGDDQELTVGEEVSVFMIGARRRVGDAAGDRKRRDTVQSICYVSATDSYLTASQKGAISIWSNKLRLQTCAEINETAWVTGCDYLPVLRRVAICTERSMAIWDNRAKGKNQSVFTIKPIEHSPQCMTWVPYSTNLHEDAVLFGDDQGYVNLIIIAAKDLTTKNSKGDKKFTQNYFIDPKNLTYPIKKRKLHDDWVVKVKYFPELRCFASCSPSSTSSFVLEEVQRMCDDGEVRGVSIPKGVNAFDYCVRANIIATGGVDKVIRVWHPHIFSRPTGKLIGHLFTIVDITCNEKDQHLISLSTARVIRIWDIHTLTSLQVFTDNEERPGEKRIYSMMFDNKHERLLTGSSVIDAWPLTRAVQDTMQVPHTHDRPINVMLFNRELNQLITVCTESIIRVWEVEAGKQVYHITEPHGSNTEVCSIALDKSGYRLATGANDGSIKVWDFGSGQEIKWKTGEGGPEEDHAVLGLQYCEVDYERCIIALGWNNLLQILVDSNDNNDLPILHEFMDVYYMPQEVSLSPSEDPFNRSRPLPDIGETPSLAGSAAQITNVIKKPQSASRSTFVREYSSAFSANKEYLLTTHELSCMCSLRPKYLLATGCTNGNIIFWNTEKAMVETILQVPEHFDTSSPNPSQISSRHQNNSRQDKENAQQVNAITFLVYTTRKLDPAFIKSLTQHDEEEYSQMEAEEEEGEVGEEDGVEKSHTGSQSESRASQPIQTGRSSSKSLNEDTKSSHPEDKVEEEAAEIDKKEDEEEEKDDDPDSHMIVETYDPILVSCHQDSFIRFWNLKGELLREMTAMTRRQGSAVTAVCHSKDCDIMITGDQRGYLTLWQIGAFLENPESESKDLVKQLLCWRGHLTRIVELEYLDNQKAIVSGSTDGSVRVWWGLKGRFVGFYGQHRAFNFPTSEETASTPVLPYDITEGPLAPVKSVSARQKIKAQQRFEYPLIFDNERWQPFRRSAYMTTRTRKQEPEDKKFFAALIKPKAYNNHLESFTTGEMRSGAVFRALPVYRVRTPERPRQPDISTYRSQDEDTPPYLIDARHQQKGAKEKTKGAGKENDKAKNSKKGGKPSVTISTTPTNIPSPRRR